MPWTFFEGIRHRPAAVWQSGGISRLLPVGEILRLKGPRDALRRAISQSVFYVGSRIQTSPAKASPRAATVLSSLREILTRSDTCPLAPRVEAVLREHLKSRFNLEHPPAFGLDAAIDLLERWCRARRVSRVDSPLERFDDEPDGSCMERKTWSFFQETGDGRLAPWVHPQMPFSAILGRGDDRRADFVVAPPWAAPLVWEVHGRLDPHDAHKSAQLAQAGFSVFDHQVGVTSPAAIKGRISELIGPPNTSTLLPWESFLIDAPWVAGQIDLCLLYALERGAWSPSNPVICIYVDAGLDAVARAAVDSWLELASAIERIWPDDPTEVVLKPSMSVSINDAGPGLKVHIEPSAPTYLDWTHDLPADWLLVRRGCFPCDLDGPERPHLDLGANAERQMVPDEKALLTVMQRLFDKPGFRPGQVEAIEHAAAGRDALILLPTGYGKSIVFQVASFLLPGFTLIVEPYRALIDDQERNLQDAGIGRVVAIHSGRLLKPADLRAKLSTALMVYIAAERMHVTAFVSVLTEVARERGLDLFVVDEAHTVSQFGHSFRPAYLDLAERIESIAKKAGVWKPTALALTATAAPKVIRDIQALLRIDNEPVSLDALAPRSFARPNLEDSVDSLNLEVPKELLLDSHKSEEHQRETVRGLLRSLLARRPEGQGIVFCPTKARLKPRNWIKKQDRWVSGPPLFGAEGIREEITEVIGPTVAIGLYTGASDKDSQGRQQMTEDAAAFSRGEMQIMVATSAFGTGVDLQGVRWTMHVGMPAGLEAYYQESGRAGRDDGPARNFLVVDWDSEDLLNSLTIDAGEKDPIGVLQRRLGQVKRSGSIARQLGLLIGDSAPVIDQPSISKLAVQHGTDGKDRRVFRPSFPGWEWEADHVDREVIRQVLAGRRDVPVEVWCHTWWEDAVWKAVNRLAVLGVIRHGFQHTLRKGDDDVTAFVVERCDNEQTLSGEALIARVEKEVTRLLSFEYAQRECQEVRKDLDGAEPAGRLLLCSRTLLKAVYRVVFETRIESLRSLVRYAREPLQGKRRDIVEDHFAPSPLKRAIFRLCEVPCTEDILKEALSLAEKEPRWRSGVFAVAAETYPGVLLPRFLLAIGGITTGDPTDAARYLFETMSDSAVALPIREWCFQQVTSRARRSSILRGLLDALGTLLRIGWNEDVVEPLIGQMSTRDGESELAHVIVGRFLRGAMERER